LRENVPAPLALSETAPEKHVLKAKKMKRICIIDGQGGGIGSAIIKRITAVADSNLDIVALGTNAIATAQMLKARANRGASGENAIVHTVRHADIIIGPVGIIMADSMMGELTPAMAHAVASSPARKLLLPLSQENIEIVGQEKVPLPHLIDALITENLKSVLSED